MILKVNITVFKSIHYFNVKLNSHHCMLLLFYERTAVIGLGVGHMVLLTNEKLCFQ